MEIAPTASHQLTELLQPLKALGGLLVTLATLMAGYQSTRTPVTLVIDDNPRQLRTHQESVDGLLADVGIQLHPRDQIVPPPQAPINPGTVVRVNRAHPVEISVDGQSATIVTHATSVDEILNQAKVTLGPYDELRIEGDLHPSHSEDSIPRIVVRRAVPLTVREEDQTKTLYTTATTVGHALHEAGYSIYLADRVRPELGTRVSADMEVALERSTLVTLHVDGRSIRTRTHRERVGDVLADLGIVLTGLDYTVPAQDALLDKEAAIDVYRVTERYVIEQEPIPFESVWRPDPDLEIDNQKLLQEGAPGVRERRIHVRYENGQEVTRTVENEYVAVPPTTNVRGYGTKIVVRAVDTPSGPVEYWRKIHMLATSYSASTAGTPASSPWYGRTATGARMSKGIVAVDPRVIGLGSEVYVPQYGVGVAADTGNAIKGKRIDLGYDDHNLELWYRWVDVYMLTPVPPANQIDYTLP